jgi:hypothetical protein
VFRICKGFGEHWQYSIFFCVLKPIDRVRLQASILSGGFVHRYTTGKAELGQPAAITTP